MNGVKTYLEALMKLDEAPLKVDPGQVIFETGDPGREMFIVRTGSVELRTRGYRARDRGQGGIFGELALVDAAPPAVPRRWRAPTARWCWSTPRPSTTWCGASPASRSRS